MIEEQKQKLERVVYTLKTINSKINNLKVSFNDTTKRLEDNLTIDDKTYEYQRINNINSNLSSAASTIRDNIIPRIKRKVEQ